MKKILLFVIFAIAVFCGCEKEDEGNSVTQDPQITLMTNKKVGETIVLRFRDNNKPTEVIGATKISEEEIDMDGGIFDAWVVDITYELTSQTVIVKGDIAKLRCRDNGLTSLDVSKCPGLDFLQCDNNQLTMLNVSNNSELGYLECDNNQLTQLDVSKNSHLAILSCSGNKLTSLDVSKNLELEALFCGSNKLTSLDVSKNIKLYYLNCKHNEIKEAEMSKIIKVLPDWTGKLILYFWDYPENYATISAVSTNSDEGNEVSEADIKIAEEKNWRFF